MKAKKLGLIVLCLFSLSVFITNASFTRSVSKTSGLKFKCSSNSGTLYYSTEHSIEFASARVVVSGRGSGEAHIQMYLYGVFVTNRDASIGKITYPKIVNDNQGEAGWTDEINWQLTACSQLGFTTVSDVFVLGAPNN